jgi:hypothetical protein
LLNSYAGKLPEQMVKLRDWLWEKDAAPDKPAAPPWEKASTAA